MIINLKDALRPFRRRLAVEGVVRAGIAAGAAVLPCWLALSLVCRALAADWPVTVWMLAAYALVFAALYALKYRPTLKSLAGRLDATGQMDRMSTMVEFLQEDSVLHRMQREDAVRRLAAISPKALRITFSAPVLAVCICLAALIAAVPHIPDEAFARIPGLQRAQSEEELMLLGRLEELREAVQSSELEPQDKEKLLAQVDSLFERMKAGRMEISAVQEIRRTMEQMTQTVAELTPRDTYTAAMLEFERLTALAEAIFDENMDVVTLVFDNIRYELAQKTGMEQVDALMNLVYDVNASLAKPLRDNSQETLRQGMMAFSAGLEMAADMVYNKRDNTRMIESAISSAEEYIREFLGVASDEERYDPYDEIRANRAQNPGQISAAMRMPALPEVELSPTQTEYVYHPPEGLRRSSYAPGETGEDGKPQRILAPADEERDGTVPYGTVYSAYYAEYLKKADTDAIPAHLQDAAKAYFNGI